MVAALGRATGSPPESLRWGAAFLDAVPTGSRGTRRGGEEVEPFDLIHDTRDGSTSIEVRSVAPGRAPRVLSRRRIRTDDLLLVRLPGRPLDLVLVLQAVPGPAMPDSGLIRVVDEFRDVATRLRIDRPLILHEGDPVGPEGR